MAVANAIGDENVLIGSGDFCLTILPQLGGKIGSVRVQGHELLEAPLAAYASRTRTMAFDEGDASGWDECLPSVAACTLDTCAGRASIPDHGDVWRVGWRTMGRSANSVALRVDGFSLPLSLERTVTVTETGGGWKLSLAYAVTNTGSDPAPWSWAAHPLFVVEAGDRIVLPDSIRTLRLEGSRGRRLGQHGDSVAWPIATLADGGRTDLSLAQPRASGIGDKLFAGPLSEAENWCALERTGAGVPIRIKLSFDPVATPYLGLWICYGGWPDRPGPKQMCVALEPATAPVDSLAQTGPWSRVLAPGDCFRWPMDVEFEPLERVI